MTKGESTEAERAKSWFGLTQIVLSDSDRKLGVTIGPVGTWDKAHVERLNKASELAGINPVIDSDFTTDEKPYAAIPILSYPNLTSVFKKKKLDWKEKASIVEVCARILDGAHKKGLFHGAVCPEQVLIDNKEVFVDGIGMGLGGTAPESAKGFVAPEVTPNSPANETSDVYSLGKLLEAISEGHTDIPRSAKRLITWSTSENPEARPPTALEFASVIRGCIGEHKSKYQAGYIAISEYQDLIQVSAKKLTPASDKESTKSDTNDISFADLKARQEARRKPSKKTVKGIMTDETPAEAASSLIFSNDEEKSNRLLPILVGAALLLIGAFWLTTLGGDEKDDSLAQGSESSDTSEDVSSPVTEDSDSEDDIDSKDQESRESSDDTIELNPKSVNQNNLLVSTPIDVSKAGLQVVHGIPGVKADLYFDKALSVKGFESGTIAGPATTKPGNYNVSLYEAADNPSVIEADRSDQPILTGKVKLGEEPVSVVAFIDSSGNPTIDSSTSVVTDLEPGYGRVIIHNYSTAKSVDVSLGNKSFTLNNGSNSVNKVNASELSFKVDSGDESIAQPLNIKDGQLSNLYIYGSSEDGIEVSEIRLSGLESSPSSVPSGNSGLLEEKDDNNSLIALFSMLLVLPVAGIALRKIYRDRNETAS